jgi:hypothetical protein
LRIKYKRSGRNQEESDLKKLLKNYRLSSKIVRQVEELSLVMGGVDATAVIIQAIQEKHDRFLEEHGTRLSKRRDGKYDVIKGGEKIAIIGMDQVDALPEKKRNEFLDQGVLHGEIELLLDVAAGRGKAISVDIKKWTLASTKPKKKIL